MVAIGVAADIASALALSLALSGLIAWSGPVDPPRARGSHSRPTPTSGGLAILTAAALGALIFAAVSGVRFDLMRVAAALGLAGLLGLLGALDDLRDYGARAKLLLQVVAALAFAFFVGRIEQLPFAPGVALPLGPLMGAAGTALWVVVAINAVNFMDGANGVAPGAAAIALLALAIAAVRGGDAVVGGAAAAAAAAGAGFLPWNLAGRLFQGDAGALFSGGLLAMLSVLAAGRSGEEVVNLYFAPLALLPFLTDVLLTLLDRARRGEVLFQAHKDHLYQLWLERTGKPHAALAWRVATIMAMFGGYAVLVQAAPAGLHAVLFAAAVLISAAAWTLMRRRLLRRPG